MSGGIIYYKQYWTMIFGLAVCLLLSLACVGFAGEKATDNVIKAKGFQLVDDDGNIRGGFEISAGNPVLYVNDGRGVSRGFLAVDDNGPILGLKDGKNNLKVALQIADNGTSGLRIHDDNGKLRISLMLNNSGPDIVIINDKGEPVVGMGLAKDGSPMVYVCRTSGKLGAAIGVFEEEPRMLFKNKDEKVNVAIGIEKNQDPTIRLFNQSQRTQLLVTQRNDGPGIYLMDESGRARSHWAYRQGKGVGFGMAYPDRKSGVALSLPENSGPGMLLADRTGAPKAMLNVDREGAPSLAFVDSGKPNYFMGLRKGLPVAKLSYADSSIDYAFTDSGKPYIGVFSKGSKIWGVPEGLEASQVNSGGGNIDWDAKFKINDGLDDLIR